MTGNLIPLSTSRFHFATQSWNFDITTEISGLCRNVLYVVVVSCTATKLISEYTDFGKKTPNWNNDNTPGESRSSKSVIIESRSEMYILLRKYSSRDWPGW